MMGGSFRWRGEGHRKEKKSIGKVEKSADRR